MRKTIEFNLVPRTYRYASCSLQELVVTYHSCLNEIGHLIGEFNTLSKMYDCKKLMVDIYVLARKLQNHFSRLRTWPLGCVHTYIHLSSRASYTLLPTILGIYFRFPKHYPLTVQTRKQD